MIREELDCKIYPPGCLSGYKYAVICTFFGKKILLSRHKDRSTWEMQGGHIESGESPLECAKRELFEESGVRNAVLYHVCDYEGFNSRESSAGAVFLAVADNQGELPESEMTETMLFDCMPPNITYPLMMPKLLNEVDRFFKDKGV